VISPKDFRVLLVYPNLSMMLTPASSVGIFTRILKNLGYTIEFFDCTPYDHKLEFLGEPLTVTRATKLLNSRTFDAAALFGDRKTDLVGDFSKILDTFEPHAVIFSTLVEDTWPQQRDLLDVIQHYPQISHVVGGVFTMMAPEIAIDYPSIQCIGTGEGEEVVEEFCEAVRAGVHRPTNIKGTWARTPEGTIIKNPSRPLVDINKIIPDYSLFESRRFLRPLGAKIWKAVSLETYRGCPYTCTFCNSPSKNLIAKEAGQGNYLRRKSMKTLRQEIQGMVDELQAEFLYINDDAFMARPREELFAIAEVFKEFKLPFWFQTRFEDIDHETLTALKNAGCYRISFGLEHGNEKFRKERLLRNISNEKILNKAKVVTEVGIPYTLNNIVGFPYETRDLLFETIDFNRQIQTWDSLSVNTFVPYHGTTLRKMAIKEGWLNPERQTTSVISESILEMPPPHLNSKEILGLVKTFPLYARMPKERYPEIQRSEIDDEEGNQIFKKLSAQWYEMTYGTDEANRMLTYQG